MLNKMSKCPGCGQKMGYKIGNTSHTKLMPVNYDDFDNPCSGDGPNEYECPFCGTRRGRWTGKVLVGNDHEYPPKRENEVLTTV